MRQRSFLNASLAVLAPAILALAVSACAQDYAGITRAEVTFEDGALAGCRSSAARNPAHALDAARPQRPLRLLRGR